MFELMIQQLNNKILEITPSFMSLFNFWLPHGKVKQNEMGKKTKPQSFLHFRLVYEQQKQACLFLKRKKLYTFVFC